MRSVVVVLPASMCAMIPMFRVLSSVNWRAMASLDLYSGLSNKNGPLGPARTSECLSGTSRYVLEVSIVRWVAPGRARMSASDRGTATDYSKGIPLRPADLLSAKRVLAPARADRRGAARDRRAVPLYTVVVGALQTPQRSVSAGSNHGYALALVAVAAVAMAVGAARGARAAAVALVALGLVALLVALAVDLPDTRQSGLAARVGQLLAGPRAAGARPDARDRRRDRAAARAGRRRRLAWARAGARLARTPRRSGH